ncbi:MAG: DUF6188 family protein [Hyphomicrobium sp.]|nr:hypothetical protein [Hyphomicrobium sp.]
MSETRFALEHEMPPDQMIADSLLGKVLQGVRFGEEGFLWTFAFDGGVTLTCECPWRIVHAGRIAFTDTDHDQIFGRASPIDGHAICRQLLAGQTVKEVAVSADAGDLLLGMSNGARLQTWTSSAGYESWQLFLPTGDMIVAMGGGERSIVKSTDIRKG